MQFLVYIVVMLVSIGGILVELDWLTKPKLETKSPVEVASTAVSPRVVRKADGPSEGPSPVPVTKQDAAAPVADKAEATGAAPADQAGTAPPVSPPPFPSVVTSAKAETEPQASTPTPPASQPQTPAAPKADAPQIQQAAQPVAVAAKAPNSCDVQGCASAYQSFRPSDCTYQPMEGPRKICEKPAAGQRAAAVPREPALRKQPSRDAELRDVERTVRRITARDDADADARMGRSQVIVIERPDRDW
jgi:hypothetical protein